MLLPCYLIENSGVLVSDPRIAERLVRVLKGEASPLSTCPSNQVLDTDRSHRRDRGDRAAVLDLQEDQEEWLTVMFLRR